MRKLNAALLILSVIFLCFYSSCCSESECVGEAGLRIELKGYPSADYVIEVERYFKNGNFDSLINKESYTLKWTNSVDLGLPTIDGNNSSDLYDYRYTLLEDGNTFTIINLEVDRSETLRKCGIIKTEEALSCPYASIPAQGSKVNVDGRKILLTK